MRTQDPLEIKNNQGSQQQPQAVTTAADLILHYLEQIGVEYVFGIPGGAIEPLYDSLARRQRQGGIRPIVARHESGAAFMAEGYARESGKLGVCCATTGPGATNMITGVASALLDQTPLLVITGQTSRRKFGRGAFQESSCTGINTVAMYQHCTRYSTLVSHVDQLERKLLSALNIAMNPPFGPAHLSIPYDVLQEPVSVMRPARLDRILGPRSNIDMTLVEQLYRLLHGSQRALFIIGKNAREAAGGILELATLINAKVVTTPDGKGLISPFHPQYRGVYGFAGHSMAEKLVTDQDIDLALVIGVSFDEYSTNGWQHSVIFSDKAVIIDATPLHFDRSPNAHLYISGSIKELFSRLTNRFFMALKSRSEAQKPRKDEDEPLPIRFERRSLGRRKLRHGSEFQGVTYFPTKERRQDKERRATLSAPPAIRHFMLAEEEKYLSTEAPIKPQRLMYDLSRLFPAQTRFIADVGNCLIWAIHYLHPANAKTSHEHGSDETIRFGMGYCSMGWGISAAVGTALASPSRPVVCIAGDGALLMSGQEISTAVKERLNVIFVILNDSALGTVKHGQLLGKAEAVAYELPMVDFSTYAQAVGADGYIVNGPQDLANLDMHTICKRGGPTVLDVRIDPNEIPPLETRIKMLKN